MAAGVPNAKILAFDTLNTHTHAHKKQKQKQKQKKQNKNKTKPKKKKNTNRKYLMSKLALLCGYQSAQLVKSLIAE